MITIEDLYQLYKKNPLITTDSRNVIKGSIFFALKGESFDGNAFAVEAINQGCAIAIVDDINIVNEKCYHVNNVLAALQNLAHLHRIILGLRVIGITGSNGKTTTKELINSVLAQKFKVFATKGNLNNHIGVPLTLLSLTKDINIAIVEMGANHPGEIAILSSIAEPDYGIITNIGKAHLGGFGSFEGVIKTKGELYKHIAENNGCVLYNPDNEILKDLIKKYKLEDKSVPYGIGLAKAEINKKANTFLCIDLVLDDEKNTPLTINTNLVGSYNFENVMAAITVGLFMNAPIESIKFALENYTPSNSRSQLVKTAKNEVILDAYNANPSSMEVAIKNFTSFENRNKALIIGEMLELGEYSEFEHQRIAELAKTSGFNKVIFIGQNFEKFSQDALYFKDSRTCANYLAENQLTNSIVLLKGSRGVKLETVMEQL